MAEKDRISSLEARVEYLEDVTRSMSEALQLARSTGNIRIGPEQVLTRDAVVAETDSAVRRILPVRSSCYLFLDPQSMHFDIHATFPEQSPRDWPALVDRLIDNGSFAWALREGRPINAPTEDHGEILLHVIGEGGDVRGMFLADMDGGDTPDVSQDLLSIFMQKCDTALRTLDLFDSVSEANRRLEDNVVQLQENEQELKRQMDARTRAEERYTALVREASVGIFRVDEEGRILDVNPALARMSGYDSPEEMTGDPSLNMENFHALPDDHNRLMDMLHSNGSVTNYETRSRRKDGSLFWVMLNCRYSNDPELGRVIEGFAQDITARKDAEKESAVQREQLRQADKMTALGILVSGVAHEVNNPNGVITLNTPILAKVWQSVSPLLDSHMQEHGDFSLGGMPYSIMRTEIPYLFSEIQDSGMRIKRIVEDLKDFARQDKTGEHALLDLNEVVETAVRLVQTKIRKTTTRFSRHVSTDLPPVLGNAQRLEQVMVNLLINACQAVDDPDAAIELSVLHDAGTKSVHIAVRDEGHGIDEEDLPHVVDPFFTTKRDRGGTGLGLAVSAGIVQDHNGRLSFESQKGRGTTATVVLPVANGSKVE